MRLAINRVVRASAFQSSTDRRNAGGERTTLGESHDDELRVLHGHQLDARLAAVEHDRPGACRGYFPAPWKAPLQARRLFGPGRITRFLD